MPLSKAKGNMYDWITHTWNAVLGECPHKCKYCYVKTSFWTRNLDCYKGKERFNEKDVNINLGKGKKIFVCHTNDLFAVHPQIIHNVIDICNKYPENTYVFQTKNPSAALLYADYLPSKSVIGTTIETDNDLLIRQHSVAPRIKDRVEAMIRLKDRGFITFITIEPIMNFTPTFPNLISVCEPEWVNIGADSKGNKLSEPTWDKIQFLINQLQNLGIKVKEKSNLERLRP